MSLTTKGESLIEPLAPYFQKSPSLSDMENKLQKILSMEKVIVVRGDLDDTPAVKNEISQEAAFVLLRLLRDSFVIAVGGGPIMAGMAEALPSPSHEGGCGSCPRWFWQPGGIFAQFCGSPYGGKTGR